MAMITTIDDLWYYVILELGNEEINSAWEWCIDNIGIVGKDWRFVYDPWRFRIKDNAMLLRCRFIFHSEKDYVWFKITWG